jgi:hypothetical protein
MHVEIQPVLFLGVILVGNWWVVEFQVGHSYARLQNKFADLFTRYGRPRGAALFLENRRGAGYALFFTPAAAELAEGLITIYGGKPCQPPQRATAFLVGSEQDRTMVPLPQSPYER